MPAQIREDLCITTETNNLARISTESRGNYFSEPQFNNVSPGRPNGISNRDHVEKASLTDPELCGAAEEGR